MIYEKDGNIGIGKTEPSYKLHVEGDAFISGKQVTGGGIKTYTTSYGHTSSETYETYEIMRISRDTNNWSFDMPYEVTVYMNYSNYYGASMTRWGITYGYTDEGTVRPLETYGSGMLKVYLGSEVVVSGSIMYRPVLVDLPPYCSMRIEVKYGTTEVSEITGSGQVKFTGTVSGGSGDFYSGDIWLAPDGGNVGIGTTSPTCKLHVAGQVCQGDIIFEKNGNKLWRMFEEKDGLYLESLKTGKTYRFILEEVVK